jgi:DNA ligase-1
MVMKKTKQHQSYDMKHFAQLIWQLGTSTKTNAKIDALANYFAEAKQKDISWLIALFTGRRPKRTISAAHLQQWCIELTQHPRWLFDECYHTVGDLAETIALLLPPPEQESTQSSLSDILTSLKLVSTQNEEAKKQFILQHWQSMNTRERFVFNKLITGGFRIGISQKTMVNALAKFTQLDPAIIAHRISGQWDPSTTTLEQLLNEEIQQTDISKPYPFYLAYAIEGMPEHPDEWMAEWKWDGIRGQLIKRNRQFYVWSRGEELMTEKFPEYNALAEKLPDGTVLDGEIIPSIEQTPLSFNLLQTRIGRKNLTKKQLQEVPVTFFAFDLLEWQGQDIRTTPLTERRSILSTLIHSLNESALILSKEVPFQSWQQLEQVRMHSRDNGAEGLMIKRLSSTYQTGRKKGDWWKWKIDPLVIDAVMIYAQKGHGRRSNLYTDYTFAVRSNDQLITFTKAYSGLTDQEIAQVDAFVKKNSLEKFGPVRTVKPELVFEIAFEGIAESKRHKSGVALRFPRINRWRKDKTVDDINTLEDLKKMLEQFG